MRFTDAVVEGFRRAFDFRGTASRSAYWWFFLLDALGALATDVSRIAVLSVLWSLGMLVPLLSCGVRRHHDAGRSGWWILTSLVPIWGWVLLAYPTKRVANRYDREGGATLLDTPGATTPSCPTCGRQPLPGERYCTSCGTPLLPPPR